MYGSRGASDSSSGIPVSGSARAFLGHVLAQLLERGPLQPRDVHLAYAQPVGDLGLRHLLVEPHGHDCPLARRQVLHRPVQDVAHLHALELRVRAPDLLGDRAAVLPVPRGYRLVERHRHVCRAYLHRVGDVVWRYAQALRQLADRGLAPELVLHLLVDAQHRLMQLLETAWKADGGALVAEIALDLARNGERGEGGELVAEVGVEALDRLDQAEVTDLDDVVEGLAAILELAGQEVDEVVIRVDKLRAYAIPFSGVGGLFVPAVERPQLLTGQPPRSGRTCSQYLLVKPERKVQPARCLTIRKLTCPVRGSMTGRKSSTKQRIIS